MTLRGLPATELVEVAARAGYDAAGVRLSPWDPAGGERPGADTIRRLRDLVDGTGVTIHDVEQIRLLPETEPASYEYLFAAAAELGVRYALIYADEPDDERFVANLRELAELGGPYGVSPVIEPMPFTPLRSPARAAALLRGSGIPHPLMLIDTLHLARSGAPMSEVDAIDPGWIPFIHLADAPIPGPVSASDLREEATFSRRLPGEGDLPLREFLDHLPAAVPVALEVPGASQGTADERATAALLATRRLLGLEGDASVEH